MVLPGMRLMSGESLQPSASCRGSSWATIANVESVIRLSKSNRISDFIMTIYGNSSSCRKAACQSARLCVYT